MSKLLAAGPQRSFSGVLRTVREPGSVLRRIHRCGSLVRIETLGGGTVFESRSRPWRRPVWLDGPGQALISVPRRHGWTPVGPVQECTMLDRDCWTVLVAPPIDGGLVAPRRVTVDVATGIVVKESSEGHADRCYLVELEVEQP